MRDGLLGTLDRVEAFLESMWDMKGTWIMVVIIGWIAWKCHMGGIGG